MTNDQPGSENSAALLLQLVFRQTITLKIMHSPAWGPEFQPLITNGLFYALEMAQTLMRSMS